MGDRIQADMGYYERPNPETHRKPQWVAELLDTFKMIHCLFDRFDRFDGFHGFSSFKSSESIRIST